MAYNARPDEREEEVAGAVSISSDTIYALSSGAPPAAIGVVRISGPSADAAVEALARRLPPPRMASLAELRHPGSGELLDNALLLRFPSPASATGEDIAELHLHGGRSVVAGVLAALAAMPGLREAQPGEFTRRAFENGRIDLSEAEGLADLLTAETESQRRAALSLAGGALSRTIGHWQQKILNVSAQLEAAIDFSDEDDVGEEVPSSVASDLAAVTEELEAALQRPSAERLKDGIRVVLGGSPNSGKSSLFNHLVGRSAAITSPIPGTTRDLVEAPTSIAGIPFLLIDTAGLRDSEDEIEEIGVAKAVESLGASDLILWLGAPEECPYPEKSIIIEAKSDIRREPPHPSTEIRLSAATGEGINELVELLVAKSRSLLPHEGEVAINRRHRDVLQEALSHLHEARQAYDPLLASEALRLARASLDRVTGRAGVEEMLDSLFGRFCIGK